MAEKQSVSLNDIVDPSTLSEFKNLNINIKEFSKNDLLNSLDPKLLTNGPLAKTNYAIDLKYLIDHTEKKFTPQDRTKNSTFIAAGRSAAFGNKSPLNKVKNNQKQNLLNQSNKIKNNENKKDIKNVQI